jgi:hypothetical protein
MKQMIRTLVFLAVMTLSAIAASAQVGVTYNEGPVTAVTYLKIEYGHFDEYIDWLNSTWKPLNEAKKKAGLIVDYKVFTARLKTPEEPNVIFMITYANMAAFDRRAEEDAFAVKMVGSPKDQNKARVDRSSYRKNLGSELIREVILK